MNYRFVEFDPKNCEPLNRWKMPMECISTLLGRLTVQELDQLTGLIEVNRSQATFISVPADDQTFREMERAELGGEA